MKPGTREAMGTLIGRIRTVFPFDLPEAQVCTGPCKVCSLKLLGYLESELDAWEGRLASGENPGLADISQLLKTSRKIGRALEKANLMTLPDEARH